VSDRIEVRGLRVMARCGILREEIERDQPFEIDLDVAVDLAAAGASDDLADTVDYGAMVDRVVEATNGHHGLMEALANQIAWAVLVDERIDSVTVTVRKLRPPVPHDLASAGVTLHRSRL
jgi:7,8-dihydroneopterin aldolase/epimerase/oxygenase